jgi:hypothetical protein
MRAQKTLSAFVLFLCLALFSYDLADAYASVVGNYICAVGSSSVTINSATYCNLFLSVIGALSLSSSSITIQFNKVMEHVNTTGH